MKDFLRTYISEHGSEILMFDGEVYDINNTDSENPFVSSYKIIKTELNKRKRDNNSVRLYLLNDPSNKYFGGFYSILDYFTIRISKRVMGLFFYFCEYNKNNSRELGNTRKEREYSKYTFAIKYDGGDQSYADLVNDAKEIREKCLQSLKKKKRKNCKKQLQKKDIEQE